MLWRESLGAACPLQGDPASVKTHLGRRSQLWVATALPSGAVVHYNASLGHVSREPLPPEPPIPGGILAEEMGLGKVRVARCVLALHGCVYPVAGV